LAIKYSEAGLTKKGEKAAVVAQNPSRNRRLWLLDSDIWSYVEAVSLAHDLNERTRCGKKGAMAATGSI
jgi:hypothetical protein